MALPMGEVRSSASRSDTSPNLSPPSSSERGFKFPAVIFHNVHKVVIDLTDIATLRFSLTS